MVSLPEVRWKLFPGETPLPRRSETTGEVSEIVEEASPEKSNEENESCVDIVLADLVLRSDFSVPVLPKGLLIVRLGPVCWYVADDPAAGVVMPWDMTPVLEASCAVSNPVSERLPLPSDESAPLKVIVALICVDKELP